jgi:hypothetical protein
LSYHTVGGAQQSKREEAWHYKKLDEWLSRLEEEAGQLIRSGGGREGDEARLPDEACTT